MLLCFFASFPRTKACEAPLPEDALPTTLKQSTLLKWSGRKPAEAVPAAAAPPPETPPRRPVATCTRCVPIADSRKGRPTASDVDRPPVASALPDALPGACGAANAPKIVTVHAWFLVGLGGWARPYGLQGDRIMQSANGLRRRRRRGGGVEGWPMAPGSAPPRRAVRARGGGRWDRRLVQRPTAVSGTLNRNSQRPVGGNGAQALSTLFAFLLRVGANYPRSLAFVSRCEPPRARAPGPQMIWMESG
eukprot:gene24192-biopygen5893